ncbi:MAG: hypothetical protein V4663_04420 [Bacteroidota bacterium]
MKNLKIQSAGVLLALATLTCILGGCEKTGYSKNNAEADDKGKISISQSESISSGEVDLTTLKTYFASQINVDVALIVYNPETEKFSIAGIDQISRSSLIQMYNQAN